MANFSQTKKLSAEVTYTVPLTQELYFELVEKRNWLQVNRQFTNSLPLPEITLVNAHVNVDWLKLSSFL